MSRPAPRGTSRRRPRVCAGRRESVVSRFRVLRRLSLSRSPTMSLAVSRSSGPPFVACGHRCSTCWRREGPRGRPRPVGPGRPRHTPAGRGRPRSRGGRAAPPIRRPRSATGCPPYAATSPYALCPADRRWSAVGGPANRRSDSALPSHPSGDSGTLSRLTPRLGVGDTKGTAADGPGGETPAARSDGGSVRAGRSARGRSCVSTARSSRPLSNETLFALYPLKT